MHHRPRHSRRAGIAVLAAAALVATCAPMAAAAPPRGGAIVSGTFDTSFEAGQPQPDHVDTPDTGPDGRPRADGVTGPLPTGIAGDVTSTVTAVAASGENPPNEVAQNLTDGAPTTKWLVFSPTATVDYTLAAPTTVVRYALTSGDDAPGRDPRDWRVQGSDDGSTWTTVDTRSGQDFAERGQRREFDVETPGKYARYRLDVTANHGDGLTQLADWLVSDGSPAAQPAEAMTTEVGSGPRGGYNTPPQVGWTGVASLHYAGHHAPRGRAHATNRVFDVKIPIARDTRLSYKIFPDLVGSDQVGYDSTYAAVDLSFTDGTLLSQLRATDQHFKPLSPRGQGASNVLYPNQWNSVTSDLGLVAAGRTVDKILLGYDGPSGPTDFAGWVDDLHLGAAPPAPSGVRPSDHVLTTRGTNSGGGFSRGNTFPATAVPHGFNAWTPVTDAGSTSWLYRYQASNGADNLPRLQGFSLSHEPSPWMGDRQTFQVMPQVGEGAPTADRTARALPFHHEDEVARAHYYGVTFDDGLRTEITPTDHAAMFRFTFPTDSSRLVLDNVSDDGGLTLDPGSSTFSGWTDVTSGGNSVGATRMFVHGSVDAPVTGSGRLADGGGPDVGGYLALDTSKDKVVTMRIATSLISLDQAKHNLALEIAPDEAFDAVRERAQQAWDDVLGVVEVQGANADQLTTLYSNLYRLNLYPSSASENTGTAQAPVVRHAVQSSTSSEPAPPGTTATATGAPVADGGVYINNGFWDTYRTTWPAYSLLYPETAGTMVNGFLQQYADGGWVSRWSSPGYADIMTGTSSDVAFADAWLRGVPGIDVQRMYDAALKNATVVPPSPNVGRKGLETSTFLGYTSTDTPESASWSLEGFINDYGIANLSKRLYETTDASDPRHREYGDNAVWFRSRAQDYVNLDNPTTGFFQGRDPDGAWREADGTFDPRVWGNEFTESDGWNFAFHAPQDGQGLANLRGGRAALAKQLDTFFATPETALYPGGYGGVIHEMREARDVRLGQWGLSNQLSHHVPYMYDEVGQPSKGAAVVREALARSFSGSDIGQGYPGDEDNGEMSAWQVFSALGLYPLQMGSPTWAIGSPLFTRATIHLASGKDLVLSAPNNSPKDVYVRGVSVNGVPQQRTWFSQDQLARGGTIVFDMGATPSRWGTGPNDAPPSIQVGDAAPRPLADVTAGSEGASDVPGTQGLAYLVDDDARTEATSPSATPTLTITPPAQQDRVRVYTLTSGSGEGGAGDPRSWVLEGSNDGRRWTTLDTREDQTFAWRHQTRAFALETPRRFTTYRLRVTGGSAATTALAEVELLAR